MKIEINKFGKKIVSRFENDDRLNKYIKNTGWMVGSNFAATFFIGIAAILVARYLGPEKFGKFSYWIAIVSLVQPLIEIASSSIVTRAFTLKKYSTGQILGSALLLRFIGSFVAFIAAYIYFSIVDGGEIGGIIIALGLLLCPFEIIEGYYLATVNAKISSLSMLIGKGLSALIKILFIYLGLELGWFVIAQSLTLALPPIVLLLIFISRDFKLFTKIGISIPLFKELFNLSFPLIFSGLFALIYLNIDQVFIEKMLGEYDLGIYSVSVKLSTMIYFIPVMVGRSFLPGFIKTKEQSEKLFLDRIYNFSFLLVSSGLIFALSLMVTGRWLVVNLFGNEYLEAIPLFKVHVISLVFIFVIQIKNIWVVVYKNTWINLASNIIGAVVNIVLNLLLIPRIGLMGAAWATIISYFVSSLGSSAFFKESRSLFFIQFKALFIFPFLYDYYIKINLRGKNFN